MADNDPQQAVPSVQVPATEATPPATQSEGPDMRGALSESFDALMRGEMTEASSALIMQVVVPGALALVMLIVTYFVAKFVSGRVSSAICSRFDKTLGKFVGKLVFYSIVCVAGLSILQTAGIPSASFAAVIAATGFAVGLAFQGTLSNFASGVLLLVFRPFKVGDVVNAAGVTGKVDAIDLFTTTFDTPDNRRLIIPNSSIAGSTIENISFHDHRRVEIVVGVGYGASISKTRQVLSSCAESLSDLMVTGEGRGYQIVLDSLGASSVDWKVRFWTKKDDFFPVQEALTSEIKTQLDEFGIDIPYPQMELHVADQVELASRATGVSLDSEIPTLQMPSAAGRNPVRPRPRGADGLGS